MILYLSTFIGIRIELEMLDSLDLEAYIHSDEFYKWFGSSIEGRFGTASMGGCVRPDGIQEIGWQLADFSEDYREPCIVLGRALELLRRHLNYKGFKEFIL